MYQTEKIKIGKTNILIFKTFILNQYNARKVYCCESVKFEFPWSRNKQCRTFENTLLK